LMVSSQGLKLNGSDAAIPKRRHIGRIGVTGYDTGLPRGDVESALRKHFASCGQITDVYIPVRCRRDNIITLERFVASSSDPVFPAQLEYSFIYFVGEGAVDNALQLDGSDVAGGNVSAEDIPFLEDAHNVPELSGSVMGGRKVVVELIGTPEKTTVYDHPPHRGRRDGCCYVHNCQVKLSWFTLGEKAKATVE
ncbi:unnamed protein product, partial [Thlaspi arvense]